MTSKLDQLEALEKAVHAGPWRWWPGYGITPKRATTLTVDAHDETPEDEFGDPMDYDDCVRDMPPKGNELASFVIAARNNMPLLLKLARAALAKREAVLACDLIGHAAESLRYDAALAELNAEATNA